MTKRFQKWPKDVLHARKDQSYHDLEAIPEGLRTKKEHRDTWHGGFEEIEPITTLRRVYLGVFAEVVKISYWIGGKEDGGEFYQVNLVSPIRVAFDRDQLGTVSLDCHLDSRFDDVEALEALLTDARKFVKWHQQGGQVRSPSGR